MGHHPDSCKEAIELLSDYVDLELPPAACGEVESHLAGCPECLEFVDSLRKVIALCHAYAPKTLPAPLSESARRELENAWRMTLAARNHTATK